MPEAKGRLNEEMREEMERLMSGHREVQAMHKQHESMSVELKEGDRVEHPKRVRSLPIGVP